MSWISLPVVAAALVVLAVGSGAAIAREAQASGCEAGARVDGSSAEMAKRKMEGAGFLQIHDLKKTCTNYWHGKAIMNGAPVNLVLSPEGRTAIEGD